MNEVRKALVYLFMAIIFVVVYLLATNWIQTEKNFPYDLPPNELYFFFIQKYAPPECFKVEPLTVRYDGKYNSLHIWTYVVKECDFSQAQIYVYVNPMDSYRIPRDPKGDLKLNHGLYGSNGININVSGEDMENYTSYPLELDYIPSKPFFNRFRLMADGTSIKQVTISWRNDIFKGYFCDENCFLIEEGNIREEEPIFRGRSKIYHLNNSNSVVIRFSPLSVKWNLAQKFLDIIVLGFVVIFGDRFLISGYQLMEGSIGRIKEVIRTIVNRLTKFVDCLEKREYEK